MDDNTAAVYLFLGLFAVAAVVAVVVGVVALTANRQEHKRKLIQMEQAHKERLERIRLEEQALLDKAFREIDQANKRGE